MFAIGEAEVMSMIGDYVYPLFRFAAFLMAAPIFGTKIVSSRIRLVLSLAVTALLAPLLPDSPGFTGISLEAMIIVLHQVMIGLTLGFTLQVVFQVFVLSGQYIAMKMGLGFASMNDPSNGVSVTVMSQFYLLTTTLLFLSVNGHLKIISMLVDSFATMPVGQSGLGADDYYSIAVLGNWMFTSALSIALPILTSLLLVNIAFGIVNRAAPQMNIFAVGFPITLILGLLVMWVGFPSFLNSFNEFLGQGLAFTEKLVESR